MLPLLLASASPRRRELLERVGVTLEVRPADIDETPHPREVPAVYVARIAHEKARAVKRRPGQWVLAADTTVTIDHDLLVASDVAVSELADATIAGYVASGEWRGKAGAYAIQGIAAAVVREVRGSVTNVIGLPLAEVLEALKALGAPSGNLAAGIPA
jgi:septum formation protein